MVPVVCTNGKMSSTRFGCGAVACLWKACASGTRPTSCVRWPVEEAQPSRPCPHSWTCPGALPASWWLCDAVVVSCVSGPTLHRAYPAVNPLGFLPSCTASAPCLYCILICRCLSFEMPDRTRCFATRLIVAPQPSASFAAEAYAE